MIARRGGAECAASCSWLLGCARAAGATRALPLDATATKRLLCPLAVGAHPGGPVLEMEGLEEVLNLSDRVRKAAGSSTLTPRTGFLDILCNAFFWGITKFLILCCPCVPRSPLQPPCLICTSVCALTRVVLDVGPQL